jgi:menaquinone-dependent protoporphyrinogen IX oxidase
MKILIIYDSKYGNNKQIAEFIAQKMQKANNAVKVHYAKSISKKEALVFQPDVLLFGGPIRAGMISYTAKSWVSGFSSLLKKKGMKLNKTAVWATHAVNAPDTPERFAWKNVALKWEKLLAKVPAVKTLPGITDVSVEGMEGPMESGWQAKVDEFVEKVINL